jgi:uncharacterized membrane protein (UPF0127 family)
MSPKSLVGIGLSFIVVVGIFAITILWQTGRNTIAVQTYDAPEQMQDVTSPDPSLTITSSSGCALEYMPLIAAVIDGQATLEVAYAATVRERIKGLAQCPTIPAGKGMYFAVDPNEPTVFWMKGMLTGLDLVWLRENKVIGVTANVAPPLLGVADSDLPRYAAPVGTDGVLEVAAGHAALHTIQINSAITLGEPASPTATPSMR